MNGDCKQQDKIYSGDYKVFIKEDDYLDDDEFKDIGGVYCHFIAGNLLFQFNKKLDELVVKTLVEEMMNDVLQDGLTLSGVIGEYSIANSIVEELIGTQVWKRDQLALFNKENLYQYTLSEFDGSQYKENSNVNVRLLCDSDQYQTHICMQEFEIDIFGETRSSREHSDYLLKNNMTFGAFIGEELVSTARINSHSEKHCTIGFVFTKKDHRRMGIGKLVFNMLFEESIRMGFSHIDLFTEIGKSANSFYQHLGFKNIGETGLFLVKH